MPISRERRGDDVIRKIQALGLACVTVLAIGAMAAPGAQAQPEFEAETYPAEFSGTSAPETEVLTVDGETVECESTYTGAIAETSSTLTVHPVYSGCRAFRLLSGTVNTTGCDLLFHATSATSGGYEAHVDIVCSGSSSIKVSAGTCALEIKSQTGLTSAQIENVGNSIKIKFALRNIAYTVTKDGFLCTLDGLGNKTDGKFDGTGVIVSASGNVLRVTGS